MKKTMMHSLRTCCFVMLAVGVVACSRQQGENTTTSASAQYEALRGDVAAMLGEEPESTFVVLDSIEATGQYPDCVVNLIRGNMYGQMMSLRFAEFYLRKAIGEELHEEWPRGYYMGIYNLGLSLQERSNLEEALKVAQAGYEEVEKEKDPSLKIWGTSLQYVIGGCQLKLKQLDEGDKTMQRCYNQLMARVAADTTHAAIEQMGTMSTNIARNIQMSMVPSTFPDYEGLDMYALMTPAKEVGGDLYGYQIMGDRIYFCIGDVSGKGVPASLFMAQATRLFHVLASQDMNPAEICTIMNAELSGEDNERGMFVTMFVCRLHLKLNSLEYCNAGHNPPALGNDDGQFSFLDMESNAPIGLWPGLEYVGESIDFFKDRLLFLYTDGLNEAEDARQCQFGNERLLDVLRQMHSRSARQVIETMTREVERHRNGAEPNDDLTMLCLRIS